MSNRKSKIFLFYSVWKRFFCKFSVQYSYKDKKCLPADGIFIRVETPIPYINLRRKKMGRIITVKGTGRASAPADQVILNMELKTLHRDYMQCMSIADSKCALLQATLAKDGFSADDIKTADFKIRQDYHYGKNSAKIMNDWECHHSLKVEFPLDIPRLQQILMNIASSGVQLEFSADFTLSAGKKLLFGTGIHSGRY